MAQALIALCAAGAVAVAIAALLGRELGMGGLGLVVGLVGVAGGLFWLRTTPPTPPE